MRVRLVASNQNGTFLDHTTAWVKRFIKNCKSSLESRNLSIDLNEMELDEAPKFWFCRAQAESFSGRQKDQSLTRFTPKLDKDGILRVDGRLSLGEDLYKIFNGPYKILS